MCKTFRLIPLFGIFFEILVSPLVSCADLDIVTGSPASVKSLLHFGQIIQRGEFGHFDEGYIQTPIDLENIADVPIAMFIGDQDQLCVPKDALKTYRETQKQVKNFSTIRNAEHGYFTDKNELGFFANTLV